MRAFRSEVGLRRTLQLRCDPVDGNIYGLCEAPLARMSLNRCIIMRIVGYRRPKPRSSRIRNATGALKVPRIAQS